MRSGKFSRENQLLYNVKCQWYFFQLTFITACLPLIFTQPTPKIHIVLFDFPVPPQIAHFSFADEVVNSGEMASTQCAVTKGDFPLKITWFFNSNPIETLHGVSVMKTSQRISSLSIDSVDAIHAGVYMCLAENAAGADRYSTYLNVNGRTVTLLLLLVFCVILIS